MIPRKKGQPADRLTFKSTIWLYQGDAAWHFVTLPDDAAAKVRLVSPVKRGWGSVKVKVTVGGSAWQTSIFPDKKTGSYVLPLKAAVRKKENLLAGQEIDVSLELI